MTNLLKTAAIAALITGFANSAWATPHDGSAELRQAEVHATSYTETETPYAGSAEARQANQLMLDKLTQDDRIAVARLDGGKLIPTPFGEEYDWELLDRRVDLNIDLLPPASFLKYTANYAFADGDTDNEIDEIRLTAANEGFSHVILYGLDADAYWASFGGKALPDTGLVIGDECDCWAGAKAKALLVDTHTGEVLGTATADDVTYNIGKLADDMERVLDSLS